MYISFLKSWFFNLIPKGEKKKTYPVFEEETLDLSLFSLLT